MNQETNNPQEMKDNKTTSSGPINITEQFMAFLSMNLSPDSHDDFYDEQDDEMEM